MMAERLLLLTLLWTCLGTARAWSGNVCTRFETRERNVRYCRMRTWQACCYWGYRRECYQVSIKYCCKGWTHNGDEKCIIPFCPLGCNNGKCTSPYKCTCNDGFAGAHCTGASCGSYIKPCYPGYCGSNSCSCANGFEGNSCLSMNDEYKPNLFSAGVNFTNFDAVKQMVMFTYAIDVTAIAVDQAVWVNQDDFNIIKISFMLVLNTDEYVNTIPSQPDYIQEFELGVARGWVVASYYKVLIQGGYNMHTEHYNCSKISDLNPVANTPVDCTIVRNDFPYSLRNGDRLEFEFYGRSGGFRKLKNRDTGAITSIDFYNSTEQKHKIIFHFDFDQPVHCSKGSQTCPGEKITIQEEFTKVSIQCHWNGWEDKASGINSFTIEYFKLSSDQNGFLQETDPLNPVYIESINYTENIDYSHTYTPTEAGMYSVILEINDNANNSHYVRRLVLYDPTSIISTTRHGFHALNTSTETGFQWMTTYNFGQRIHFIWEGVFFNDFHMQNKLLNSTKPYPPQLDDGGRRGFGYKHISSDDDDNEGKRNISKIPNINGIVKFEVFDNIIPLLTDNQNILENEWRPIPLQESYFSQKQLSSGSVLGFWVRATDIMGNKVYKMATVRFDPSPPVQIQKTVISNNVQDGEFAFSSRVHVQSEDKQSGVYKVHWKLIMNDTDFEKMNGDAVNLKECIDGQNCYSTSQNENFTHDIKFDINHCWMRVDKDNLETQVMRLEMTVFNSAMLSYTEVLYIDNIPQLSGIKHYAGPENIVQTKTLERSVSLTWSHALSCYERETVIVLIIMPDNSNKTLRADKDSTRFDITGLEPGVQYTLYLMNEYIISYNPKQLLESEKSVFIIKTKLSSGAQAQSLNGGAVAGGIVAVVLVIILLVIIVLFLYRTGHLDNIMNRSKEQNNTSMSWSAIENKSYDTNIKKERIKSLRVEATAPVNTTFEEDMIYYGKMDISSKLSRSAISLVKIIGEGKFATIYKCSLLHQNEIAVAKVLKGSLLNDETYLTLMTAKINFYEADVGNHINIVNFLGSVQDNALGPFMIIEYCENGTMKDYLTKHRNYVTDSFIDNTFKFCLGICKGLCYLHEQKIVHRRLAVRNILLNFLLEPKISGFGPNISDIDKDEDERLPLKWLPPECIEAHSTKGANEKTDIWSFGIVMWEIFSLGDSPFADVKSSKLLKYLKEGKRPPKPEICDDVMYNKMMMCWTESHKKRPTARKILQEIDALFVTEDDEDHYYYSRRSAVFYDNNV